MEFDFNWLAVVVAALVQQVLGFLWYGPLFGETWLQASGKTREEVGSPGAAIPISVVSSLLAALALALLLTVPEQPSLGLGIAVGFVASLGFAATAVATSNAFEGDPPKVTALYALYAVLSTTAMGAVIGGWQ